jgi:hypothetical protein
MNIFVHPSHEMVAWDFDVGISCVKRYYAESSAREWTKLLSQCAAVVNLPNGVDGQQRVEFGFLPAKLWHRPLWACQDASSDFTRRHGLQIRDLAVEVTSHDAETK